MVEKTFSRAEIEESAGSADRCLVTIGRRVFDVAEFVDSHPGGEDLILDYAGKDVDGVMRDEDSHSHSKAAFSILNDYFVGFIAGGHKTGSASGSGESVASSVTISAETDDKSGLSDGQDGGVRRRPVFSATGMSGADDLSRETDHSKDYAEHRFLDLSKPLLMQIWYGGFTKAFYLEQVHRPRHYKDGASAPLFGNFLEPLSKTPWWIIPTLWLPCVAAAMLATGRALGLVPAAMSFMSGVALWTLIEYGMHRFLFHLDEYLPDNRVGLTAHFLLHGVHHYLPMDKYRLVMPPTLFVAYASCFWPVARAIVFWNWHAALGVYSGGVFGYVCYDLTHYFIHHKRLPQYYQELKKYHLEHHFADYENGFGVTSRFWDRVFGTELNVQAVRKTGA